MAIENQQRFGGGLHFDHVPYQNAPQFSNPWTSTTTASPIHNLYAPSHQAINPNLSLDVKSQQPRRIAPNLSIGSYNNNVPLSAGSNSNTIDAYTSHSLLSSSPEMLTSSRSASNGYESNYSTAPPTEQPSYPPNHPSYDPIAYNPAAVRPSYHMQSAHPTPHHHPHPSMSSETSRRLSQSTVSSHPSVSSEESRRLQRLNSPIEFHDGNIASNENRPYPETVEPNRGLMPVNPNTNSPTTFANAGRIRNHPDSYAYSSTMSQTTNSSLSSAAGPYNPYYGGSVDSNSNEYNTATGLTGNTSDIKMASSRTLPRPGPNGMHQSPVGVAATQNAANNSNPNPYNSNGGGNCDGTVSTPPAPQSMMGQFSSKVASSAQKKHKCKVCDKRFTRPSSLQTHMYSHTGEKPFSCEVEGCRRQFSVVSNLRRHRKVHKGEARSETGSD